MATHSSVLAQRVPWTEEPSRLQTIGSQSRTGLKLFRTEHTWALHRASSRTRCAPPRAVSIKLSVKMFRNLLDSRLFVGDLLVCLFISLESFNNLCILSILNLHENDESMPCVCVCVCVCMCQSLSHVQLFGTPWTVALQDPLSMGFSRREYWSGQSFPSPGGLPDPGIEPWSPALQTDYHLSHQRSPSMPQWSYFSFIVL